MAARSTTDPNKISIFTALFLLVGLVLVGLTLLRTAWLSDDAYISFRTADNLLQGYGLSWNIAERVQAFTHPLWLFLVTGVYAFTQEMFLTPLLISIVVSLLAVALLALGLSRSAGAAVFVLAVLLFSRGFIDYSTSGLENPLTHLLLGLFALIFFRVQHGFSVQLGLGFVAGLIALNRMDAILLVAPAILYVLLAAPKWKTLFALALGFSPFVAWLIFATIYYGFPFPNTAYAKLGTGIPQNETWIQGLRYFQNSLTRDPLTLPAILLGIGLAGWRKEGKQIVLAIGVVLYLIYIVRIGGDFMAGRFFTAPLFLAMILVVRGPGAQRVTPWLPALLLAIGLASLAPYMPIATGKDFGQSTAGFKDDYGIGDERRFYYQSTGLLHYQEGLEMPRHRFAQEGRAYARSENPGVNVHGSVGFRGFFGGPKVHIIDYYALADPLLARIPAEYAPNWRIGHFRRTIPTGYRATAGSEQNRLQDPLLAAYYDKLRLITSGPIWDEERLRAIVEMNLGLLDQLVDERKYRFPRLQTKTAEALSQPLPRNYRWNGPLATVLQKDGLWVEFERPQRHGVLEMSMDHNDIYRLYFYRQGERLGYTDFEPGNIAGGNLTVEGVPVPNAAIRKGFDAIHILGREGDGLYSIGHLRPMGSH